MKKAALYIRVSSQEQKLHGVSIDNQLEALKEYAAEHNLDVYSVYNDAGISARKKYKKRPELLRLIEDVKSNKVDIILFTKLDRWFRSVADYYEVQSVLDQYKVPWRAIWEDYETETTNGIFKVNIMLSVAQQEADRTSDRLKAVNKYRREQGEFMGSNPARGYKKIAGNQLVFDPELEPYVRLFFDTYLRTLSPIQAIEAISPKFKMSRTQAARMLRNPTYMGDCYGCKCPAYISPEQHKRICDSIEGRRVKERISTDRTYLFTGMIVCPECGKYMVARTYHHENYTYKMYHCPTNSAKHGCRYGANVYESHLESFLLDQLDRIIEDANIQISSDMKSQASNEDEIKKIRARLKRMATLYELGDMEDDEYIEKRRMLNNKIKELEATRPTFIKPLPEGWKNIYNDLTEESRKDFWKISINKIRVYGKGRDKDYKIEF